MLPVIVIEVDLDRNPAHLIERVSSTQGRRVCTQPKSVKRSDCFRVSMSDCPPLACAICKKRVVELISFHTQKSEEPTGEDMVS